MSFISFKGTIPPKKLMSAAVAVASTITLSTVPAEASVINTHLQNVRSGFASRTFGYNGQNAIR